MNPNKSSANARGRGMSAPLTILRRAVRSPRSRFYGSLTLALALLFAIGSSLLPKAGAQNTRAHFQQDLAQVFTGYEQMTLDPRSVGEQVRASGRVSLVSTAHDFELQLQP